MISFLLLILTTFVWRWSGTLLLLFLERLLAHVLVALSATLILVLLINHQQTRVILSISPLSTSWSLMRICLLFQEYWTLRVENNDLGKIWSLNWLDLVCLLWLLIWRRFLWLRYFSLFFGVCLSSLTDSIINWSFMLLLLVSLRLLRSFSLLALTRSWSWVLRWCLNFLILAHSWHILIRVWMKTFHKVVHQVDISHFSPFLVALLFCILCYAVASRSTCILALKTFSGGLIIFHLFLWILLRVLCLSNLVLWILVCLWWSILLGDLFLFIILLSSSSLSPESLFTLLPFRIMRYHCCLSFYLYLIIISIILLQVNSETFSLIWIPLLFSLC